MIDLNSPLYSVNLENEVLSRYSSYQVFKYYIPNLKVGTSFNSPLRKDNVPSFSVFDADGVLLYKDFRLGESGDCFKLVQQMFNYATREDAIKRVMYDFGIIDYPNIKRNKELINIPKHINISKPSSCIIEIKTKPFTQFDLDWWGSYNISYDILKKYNVFRCEFVFKNGKGTYCPDNNPAYAYIEAKDNNYSYKIYRPFMSGKDKWLSNIDRSVWQGWTQMPKEGKHLIITKSYKDIMSIVSSTQFSAIAMQNESTIPKTQILTELSSRFENIYIFYDNDFDKEENWGQLLAAKLKLYFDEISIPTTNILIPNKYLSKDYSDLVKNKGLKTAKNFLNNAIKRSIRI